VTHGPTFRPLMMVVKMTFVNVGTQVSVMSARAIGLVGCGRKGGDGGGSNMALFADILYERTHKLQFQPEFKPQKR